jgi:hypothetical protein
VSDALREKMSLHRKFARARWALPEPVLGELERVRSRFEPEDAVRRYVWLFGPRWQLSETPENEQERLEQRCPDALRRILREGGWQDVLRLVKAVEAPEEVGVALARIGATEEEPKILPGLLASGDETTARFV